MCERGRQRADAAVRAAVSWPVGFFWQRITLVQVPHLPGAKCNPLKTNWLFSLALLSEEIIQEKLVSRACPLEFVFNIVLLIQTILRQERGSRYLWVGCGVNYPVWIQPGTAETLLDESLSCSVPQYLYFKMQCLIKPHWAMSNSSSRPTGTHRTEHFHFRKGFLTDFNPYKMLQPASVPFQKIEKVRQGNFVKKLCEMHFCLLQVEKQEIFLP